MKSPLAPILLFAVSAAYSQTVLLTPPPEPEINFSQILSKDTTVEGYEARIKRISERQMEAYKEITQIFENLAKSYPALEPQKSEETQEEFEKRKEEWTKGWNQQFVEPQKKYEDYIQKTNSAIAVLNDYIIATKSTLPSETAELVAQDTTNTKTQSVEAVAITEVKDTSIDTGISASTNTSTSGLGWRGITRIVAFSATAVLGAASIYKHIGSKDNLRELDDLKAQVANTDEWKNSYNTKADEVREKEQQRNIFGAAAGVFAVSGAITFFF